MELGVRHKRRVIRTIPREEVDLLSKRGILVKFNSFRQVAFQRFLDSQDGVDNVRHDSLGLPKGIALSKNVEVCLQAIALLTNEENVQEN